MSEFIDRLADIIAAQINPDHNGEISRENALHVAGAVVKAMREPTEAMKRAGEAEAPMWDDLATPSEDYWAAMIDAALSEAKETA